jgi:hypothetical protein
MDPHSNIAEITGTERGLTETRSIDEVLWQSLELTPEEHKAEQHSPPDSEAEQAGDDPVAISGETAGVQEAGPVTTPQKNLRERPLSASKPSRIPTPVRSLRSPPPPERARSPRKSPRPENPPWRI